MARRNRVVVSTRVAPVDRALIETLACQEGCSVSQTVRRILKHSVRTRLHEELGVALTPGRELSAANGSGQDV